MVRSPKLNSVLVLRVEHASGLGANMYTTFESLVRLDRQSEDRTHVNKKTVAGLILGVPREDVAPYEIKSV